MPWARLTGTHCSPSSPCSAHASAATSAWSSSAASRAEQPAVRIDLGRFWDTQAETAALAESLAHAGFNDSAEVARLLLELRGSALVRKLDEPGRRRLQTLLPVLLADVAHSSAQLPVLRRVLAIIEAIGQRSAYFALLHENGAARARLVELCRHGDFLAAQIAAHPLLLDELHRRAAAVAAARAGRASRASLMPAWNSCARRIRSGRSRPCASSSARRCFAWRWRI